MKKFLLSAGFLVFLAVLTFGAGKEVGEIGSIDAGKKEVIVNVKSGNTLRIGDLLQIDVGEKKITLQVTYPMQTIAKCKIKGKGKLSDLSKGMLVYRYSKDDDNNAVADTGKTGQVKKFGSIEMVYIEGGTFMMGSPESEKKRGSDETQHEVTVSSYWMGKYEVTQKQYKDIMGTNPANFKGDNLPVEEVNWYDAVEYCNKLSVKQGLKPYYKINKNSKDPNNENSSDDLKYTVTILGGNGFRLPTEAEWEYACRGGTTTVFYYGNSLDSTMANFDGDYPYSANKGEYRAKTTDVGSFKPNAWGLYDMHGNVWEWCWDWYGSYGGTVSDPQGADSGSDRVLRGGSWINYGYYLRSASRSRSWASGRGNDDGFRVVRSAF